MDNSLKSCTTDALIDELAKIEAGHSASILRASAILCELRDRKRFHPAMRSAILRWFSEIHGEVLHPEFVIMFAGARSIITAAIGTPLATQAEWAKGGEVTLCEISPAFELIEVQKPLIRFSAQNIKVAFGEAGLRPMAEQRTIAAQHMAAVRGEGRVKWPVIRANTTEGVLVLDGKKFRVWDLRLALKQLGYEVVKAKEEVAT